VRLIALAALVLPEAEAVALLLLLELLERRFSSSITG